jgi:hypothetical protein
MLQTADESHYEQVLYFTWGNGERREGRGRSVQKQQKTEGSGEGEVRAGTVLSLLVPVSSSFTLTFSGSRREKE